ncbi:hypothetical protein GIB67_018961 [Kingdonia uniflora]|uniref:F-box protein n=1 Tax=Kingdonia uniflora TaxID=39325 RepID=A0A7J7NUP1_9MAGN|nr:hypothetical protein GIB67_018961 [Kingdonia uniflora]
MERGFLLRGFTSGAKKKKPNVSTIRDSEVEILWSNGSNGETIVMGLLEKSQVVMGINSKTEKLCNGGSSGGSNGGIINVDCGYIGRTTSIGLSEKPQVLMGEESNTVKLCSGGSGTSGGSDEEITKMGLLVKSEVSSGGDLETKGLCFGEESARYYLNGGDSNGGITSMWLLKTNKLCCNVTIGSSSSGGGSNGGDTSMGLWKKSEVSSSGEPEKKRVACNGNVSRLDWESTSPEILALIFVRIVADELMRVVPFVCTSWQDAVDGPYCWLDIDIEEWSRRCDNTSRTDLAVRKLMRRSKGTCRRLNVYKLGNNGYSYVANNGRCLRTLQMRMSEVTDWMVSFYDTLFANLTYLDISSCLQITCKGIAVFGNNCKSLVHLKRNIPPPQSSEPSDDGEAIAIGDTMPGLQQLEMGYGRFTDISLNALLTKCKNLTHLDILGCWSLKFEGDLEERCGRLTDFKGPWDDDYENLDLSGSDGDDVVGVEVETFPEDFDFSDLDFD